MFMMDECKKIKHMSHSANHVLRVFLASGYMRNCTTLKKLIHKNGPSQFI